MRTAPPYIKSLLSLLCLLSTAGAVVAQGKLSAYRTVAVEPFTVEKNKETTTFPEGYEAILQKLLVERLASKQLFDSITDSSNGPCERCLVLAARVVHYGKGSRAARFWIGMGAGREKVRVVFALRDRDTGNEVMRFTAEGKHYGWADGSQASTLECLGDVTDRFIEKISKERKPHP